MRKLLKIMRFMRKKFEYYKRKIRNRAKFNEFEYVIINLFRK